MGRMFEDKEHNEYMIRERARMRLQWQQRRRRALLLGYVKAALSWAVIIGASVLLGWVIASVGR